MINPLSDKVAVKVEVAAKTTPGGIELLQETDPEAPARGVIVAVGPGKYNEDGTRDTLEVAVGDIVAFPKGAGLVIPEHGVTVMTEAEIIAVVG